MADNAILGIEPLADNLRVDRCCRSDASTSPIHSIRLIDLLIKAPAVKGKVESPPAEREHEGTDKPWREGPVGILGSLLLVMIVVILIHGDSSYRLIL
jgi:flagellin-like protein